MVKYKMIQGASWRRKKSDKMGIHPDSPFGSILTASSVFYITVKLEWVSPKFTGSRIKAE